jgi:hypothetical protein
LSSEAPTEAAKSVILLADRPAFTAGAREVYKTWKEITLIHEVTAGLEVLARWHDPQKLKSIVADPHQNE